jgi:hypothetical protein
MPLLSQCPHTRQSKSLKFEPPLPCWSCNKRASALLDNKDWISTVKFCFDPQGKLMQAESMVNEEMKARADSLKMQLIA